MREQLELIRTALTCGDAAGEEHRWENIEDALWQITEAPPTPEVEKALVCVLRFKGRLRLAPSSELPHSMPPEEMLKSLAIQALGKWTGLAYLSEMQRVEATASSPVLAGIAQAVIREATRARGRTIAPTASSSTYNLPRNRDAYSTIRGYVYQVDLTLRRWLDLGENQHLELERGEDIDLVNRAINATSMEEAGRLLEQVKHREQNLTLRNAAALEALANAVEHLAVNAGMDLRFCYTTNAAVAAERPCPFSNGTAGITLWEQVRQGRLTGTACAGAIKALAMFLSQAAGPDALDATVWARFQQIVGAADLTDFTALVGRFEWSTSVTGAAAITPEIMGVLTQRGLAADPTEAEELYQRLFLFVFKRLCQSGIKQLTRAELQQQLSVATLSATDHATLGRLTQCFSIVKLQVDELEAALAAAV